MALESLRAFRGLQEERVGLYRNFEEGFLAYLKVPLYISINFTMSSFTLLYVGEGK